jgi:hypothetical protein
MTEAAALVGSDVWTRPEVLVFGSLQRASGHDRINRSSDLSYRVNFAFVNSALLEITSRQA